VSVVGTRPPLAMSVSVISASIRIHEWRSTPD